MHMEYILVFTVISVMMIQTYTHTGKMSILMKDMLENSYILMSKEEIYRRASWDVLSSDASHLYPHGRTVEQDGSDCYLYATIKHR